MFRPARDAYPNSNLSAARAAYQHRLAVQMASPRRPATLPSEKENNRTTRRRSTWGSRCLAASG